MNNLFTEYLLIVHGTFAKPDMDKIKQGKEVPWYWPKAGESNFCARLAKLLEDSPLEGSVWRGFDEEQVWHWSGDNHHYKRLDAAAALHEEIKKIIQRDPFARIHLIAHSHGGNVVLKAIEMRFRQLAQSGSESDVHVLGPEKHHIGRVVFLGTPFYQRFWTSKKASSDIVVGALIGGAILGFMFGAFFAALLALLWLAFLIFGAMFPEIINPFNWNKYFWLSYALVSFLGGIWLATSKIYRVHSNVYFDEHFFGSSGVRLKHKIPVLSVHSGPLDEALLLLSAEPVLDALLEEPVAELADSFYGAQILDIRSIRNRAGEDAGAGSAILGAVKSAKHFLSMYLNHRILKFLLEPLRRKTKKLAKAGVLRVIRGIALGLPPKELKDSEIVVSESLKLENVFDIQSLDVSRELVGAERKPESTRERADHYAFLWDDDALNMATAESETWNKKVIGQYKRLNDDYGKRTKAFYSGLQKMVLMSEKKLKEISSNVALDHSTYYEAPEVVKTVAEFMTRDTA